MARLKVLISAYSCEPGKGSEPEVGWQWALQMARFHDVTVLTRANNEPGITEGLREAPAALAPRFAYFDLRPPFLRLKKQFGLHNAYYGLWQRAARHAMSRLLKTERFDLLHHVTYAGARYRTAVLRQGVPSIFGPVGGLESMPFALLPWRHPRALIEEAARNAGNLWQRRGPSLRRKARAATATLASTTETQQILSALGVKSRLMPAIGLHLEDFPARRAERKPEQPMRLLFAGRLLYWKGLELALHALRRAETTATLTIIGDGEFAAATRQLARDLSLENRVEFRGRLSRQETLGAYPDHDAFLYPSLHDSGGFTVVEAMASALPVICLNCGGPGLAVTQGTGIKAPMGSREQIIGALAMAIRTLAEDPERRAEMGRQARERIRAEYDWDRKGEAMNEIYAEAVRG